MTRLERMRIGIDLGGTKIEGLALDEAGAELARLRVATPQHDYAATVKAIADVVGDLERRSRAVVAAGLGGRGDSGDDCAGDRAGEECELDVAEWAAAGAGLECGAGPAGAVRERCELPGGVGGDGWRGGGSGAWCLP